MNPRSRPKKELEITTPTAATHSGQSHGGFTNPASSTSPAETRLKGAMPRIARALPVRAWVKSPACTNVTTRRPIP